MGGAWSAFCLPGLPSCYGGSWPMLVAAKGGDHHHLEAAADKEPLLLLASTGLRGSTLLHLAAEKGRADTLQVLVACAARNAAALALRLREVALLVQQTEGPSAELCTTLDRCERSKRLLQPALLVPTLLSWPDSRGVTPLMLAARGGHAECIHVLLQHGADPLALDNGSRRSALHYAACCGHMRAVHALLNHGYTASQPAQQPQQARDGGGASPSPQAAGRAQQRIVLLQDATLPDGHRGAASFVDLRTRTGLSALHYAAFWGSTGCVRALLTAGASVSQQLVTSPRRQCELPVHSGSTALHLAAESGHAAMAALLLHAHVERMQRSSPRPLAPPAAGGGVAAERLPWEGNQHSDPRLVRNAIGDTPHEVAFAQRGAKELLLLLLDPSVPITWVLPQALDSTFGGPPRLGVPQLAVLAKGVLDERLTQTLAGIEQAQQQAQQLRRQQSLVLVAAGARAGDVGVGVLSQRRCISMSAAVASAASAVAATAATAAAASASVVPAVACKAAAAAAGGDAGPLSVSAGSFRSASCGSLASLSSSVASSSGSNAVLGLLPGSILPTSSSYGSVGDAAAAAAAGGAPDARHLRRGCASECDGLLHSEHEESEVGWDSDDGGGTGEDDGDDDAPGRRHHVGSACVLSTLTEAAELADDVGDSDDDSDGDHRTCSICFDAAANVMVAGCRHRLCSRCARSLVAVTTISKPALCPFCRTGMSGFLAAPTHCD